MQCIRKAWGNQYRLASPEDRLSNLLSADVPSSADKPALAKQPTHSVSSCLLQQTRNFSAPPVGELQPKIERGKRGKFCSEGFDCDRFELLM